VGKKYIGVEQVLRRVKPDTHADEVLAALPH